MGTPDSPSTPTTDTSTPPFRAGWPSYVWAGLGAITGLALLAWVFFVPAKHVDPLSTFEHRMVVAYVWFAVFLTGTWWLVKDRSGNTLRRGHLFLMWGGTVLIGIVSFSALLNAALANAYAYAGRNYIVLQTVSAVVSATATMIYYYNEISRI